MTSLRAILFAMTVGLTTAQVTPAFAAGGEKSASNKTIDLSGLVLPVERDDKLINYLFVSAMVTVSADYDHWEVREHAHDYRDMILKEAHKHPVGLEGKPMQLDKKEFEALIKKVFDKKLGPNSVSHIEIMAVDSQKIFLDG